MEMVSDVRNKCAPLDGLVCADRESFKRCEREDKEDEPSADVNEGHRDIY